MLFNQKTVKESGSDWKKKLKKKNHKKSRNSRPWYPRTTLKVNIHIFGLIKGTIIYCKKCSCFCSCCSLCCYYAHFSDLKNYFKCKMVTLRRDFFLLNAKNLGRSDDAKRRKKRGWPQLLERNHNDCGTWRCQQFRHAGQTNLVSGQKTPATLLASPQKYDEAFIHLGMNISNEKSTHPDLQNLSLVG